MNNQASQCLRLCSLWRMVQDSWVFPHSEKQRFTPGERHHLGQRLGLCLSICEPRELCKIHLLPAFPFPREILEIQLYSSSLCYEEAQGRMMEVSLECSSGKHIPPPQRAAWRRTRSGKGDLMMFFTVMCCPRPCLCLSRALTALGSQLALPLQPQLILLL